MGQVLHGSAKTTHAIRAAIQRSQASIKDLSERYGLNPKTVMKWKKRDFVDDARMGPKALSRFGQVDGDLNRRYEGTGLGLPLTKALVEQHGGVLDLQSEVGVGTTVTVRFPAERIVRMISMGHDQRDLVLPGAGDAGQRGEDEPKDFAVP